MIYRRPSNLTITEMCIYIDHHVYDVEIDENLIFEYLFHIINSLALKRKLFNNHQYYENFAVYAATKVFLRLLNKKQFQYDENGNPKLPKVKSVLNLIKKILYPLKVDFEQSEYYQIHKPDSEDLLFTDYTFNNLLYKSMDDSSKRDFNSVLNDIDNICREFLTHIPYKKHSVEWLNIYTSVMLTLCKQLTFNKKMKKYISHLNESGRLTENHLTETYNKLQEQSVILFHLDDSFYEYILLLVKELKQILCKELSECLYCNSGTDIQLMDLISLSYIGDVTSDES